MELLSSGGNAPPLYIILILLGWISLCHCLDERDIVPVPALKSTVVTTSKTSHATTTSSVLPSTITPPPPWGNQVLPVNTCYQTSTDGSIEYLSCTMHLGMVKISYFPEDSDNATYPSTWYNSDWSVTMTSPSLYMQIETADGNNQCGSMGPTFSNKVVSMPISHALTMQPYANSAAASRMGPPRPLTLSDLDGCSTLPSNLWTFIPAIMTLHPVADSFYRCNPHFVVPPEVWAIGGPYWENCVHFNDEIGIFDPPGAVPTVSGLLPSTTDSPVADTHSTASTIATVRPDQPRVTTSSSTPEPPSTSAMTKTSTSRATSSSNTPRSTSMSKSSSASRVTTTSTTTWASKAKDVPNVPAATGRQPTSGAVLINPDIIGTIGSLTITAIAGASSVVVGSQTATVGGPEIALDNHFVVTAAPNALMVYMPGGGVSSLAWPTAGGTNDQPHDAIQTTPGIGGIIASLIGISPYAAATSTVSTTLTTTTASTATASASFLSSSASTTTTTTTTYSASSSFNYYSYSFSNTTRLLNYTTLFAVTTSSSMIPSMSTTNPIALSLNSSITTSPAETTRSIPLGGINRPSSSWNTASPTMPAAQSGQTNAPPFDSGAGQGRLAFGRLTIVLIISSIGGLFVL